MSSVNSTIAIFGGTFNPPHRGHLQIAQYVLDNQLASKVLLMPSYETYDKDAESPEHRVKMTQLACRDLINIECDTFEISHQITGGTYHVIKNMLCKLVFYDIVFIIGQDAADNLMDWDKNSHKLPSMVPFIVIKRGFEAPPDNAWYLSQPHKFINDISALQISSSDVRTALGDGYGSHDYLFRHVPFAVLDYIYHHNLYTYWKKAQKR